MFIVSFLKNLRQWLPQVSVGLSVILLATALYFHHPNNDLRVIPDPKVEMEIEKLLAQVGALMDLPKDENPTVATVTDLEKLKGQAFFKNAKRGDKVLVYVNARRAILFDPVNNKIVDVAPLNIVVSPVPVPKSK